MSSMAPARTDAFQSRMADTAPAVTVAPAGHKHHVDGIVPEIAVRPRSEGELARVLAESQAARLAVIAVGSGTHLQIGNVAERYDVALETSALNETLDHESDDMTVTVDAGVTLAALQAKLAERGQRLPIDPPIEEGADATIGGLLAVNAYGPMRHAYGTLRDWVIGMRVAHPDGTVTKSGGRVVKNVSGYDMHKLHIGALGTLGVITQATFKLAPLPHASTTAICGAPTAAAACDLVMRARDAGLAVEAAEVMPPKYRGALPIVDGIEGWQVLLRLAGSTAAVDRTLRDVRRLASLLGAHCELGDAAAVWTGPTPMREARQQPTVLVAERAWSWNEILGWGRLMFRLSVPPTNTAATLAALVQQLPELGGWSATVAAGLIRLSHRSDMAPSFALEQITLARRIAEDHGGFLLIDNLLWVEVKRQVDVFGAPRSDFEIMRRLKEQFDPHRTLAPGRFIGRL